MKLLNKSALFQFIPILLILAYFTNPRSFVFFSHTVLGKLFAVVFIIFYTQLDKIYGLLACILVVFYYQTDYVEGLLNINDSNGSEFESPRNIPLPEPEKIKESKKESVDGFSEYNNHVDAETEDPITKYSEIKKQFQKEYCMDGSLIYKNQSVRTDMAEHVFPEIDFKNGKCNPCDKTCDFSVIEERMKSERDLALPASSNEEWDNNDWLKNAWNQLFSIKYLRDPSPVDKIKGEGFSPFL